MVFQSCWMNSVFQSKGRRKSTHIEGARPAQLLQCGAGLSHCGLRKSGAACFQKTFSGASSEIHRTVRTPHATRKHINRRSGANRAPLKSTKNLLCLTEIGYEHLDHILVPYG